MRPTVPLPSTFSQRFLIALVRGYRYWLSPWLGGACRFEPTCSAYALEALERHGAAAGSYLGAKRLLRCQPWCGGGHDPVPQTKPWRAAGTRLSPSNDPTEPSRR